MNHDESDFVIGPHTPVEEAEELKAFQQIAQKVKTLSLPTPSAALITKTLNSLPSESPATSRVTSWSVFLSSAVAAAILFSLFILNTRHLHDDQTNQSRGDELNWDQTFSLLSTQHERATMLLERARLLGTDYEH